MVESYHMKFIVIHFYRGQILSHKKRIKESLLSSNIIVKHNKRTNTFFKSECSLITEHHLFDVGLVSQIFKIKSRFRFTVRKKNVKVQRHFHTKLFNYGKEEYDYLINRKRNSKRVQCIALEIKTRPNERYRVALC